jgi:L-Ala-D/L-Glu epimerase
MLTLEAYKLNIKLNEPMTISFNTWYFSENVIIKLHYNGITGIGEAAPFKPITGDSQKDVLADATKLQSINLNPETDSFEKLHELLDQTTKCQTLKAAIDFAYHDLQAKIKGVPVYQLYTQTATPRVNSITVFIKETMEATAQSAKKIYHTYPDLKILKIKLQGENDIDRARAIKAVSPGHMKFLLDANQGYADPEIAVSELTEVCNILGEVVLIEEPCPKEEHEKMKYVHENLKCTKVFADESAATIADAEAVITANAAAGVNIKLQKAGGIWPSKVIAKLCADAGLKVMVGSMFDSDVATAASIHFALSTPNVILTDLDMDLDIPRFGMSSPQFQDGMRIPVRGSGLGVSLDEAKLAQLGKDETVVYERVI